MIDINSLTWTRYLSNRTILREGMAEMGFRELVPLDKSGYIITSYLNPADPNFDFVKFYTKLAERGKSSIRSLNHFA